MEKLVLDERMSVTGANNEVKIFSLVRIWNGT